MRLFKVILLLLAFPGNAYGEGIESESYYPDDDVQEEVTRRPADAVVVVRGPARPGSSSPTPTPASAARPGSSSSSSTPASAARPGSSSPSPAPTNTTAAAVPSSPPAPETKDEEDDLLHFFDKKGKKRRHSYRTGPVKNSFSFLCYFDLN